MDTSTRRVVLFALISVTFFSSFAGVPYFIGDSGDLQGIKIDDDTEESIFPLIIDSFEDSDISEYSFVTGSSSNVSFDGSKSKEGDTSVQFSETGTNNVIISSLNGDGLIRYPEAGDEIIVWFFTNGKIAGFDFGRQGPDNRYTVRAGPDGDLIIVVEVSGSGSFPCSTPISLPTGQWNKFFIDWNDDGSFSVTVKDKDGNDKGSCSYSGTDFTDGGIGLRALSASDSGDYTLNFDYIHITDSTFRE